MENYLIIGAIGLIGLVFYNLVLKKEDENVSAKKLLDKYLSSKLSGSEVGLLYERYIGYRYEKKGSSVTYNGALNGFKDMGRDLIVKKENQVYVVQAKCWAKYKTISENHIFQLYGSMIHLKKTSKNPDLNYKAVFYTTAQYSETAKKVASELGVVLKIEAMDNSYPMIKCNINKDGEKIYHIPLDPFYDNINMNSGEGKEFVHTVEEAVKKGFRWSQTKISN